MNYPLWLEFNQKLAQRRNNRRSSLSGHGFSRSVSGHRFRSGHGFSRAIQGRVSGGFSRWSVARRETLLRPEPYALYPSLASRPCQASIPLRTMARTANHQPTGYGSMVAIHHIEWPDLPPIPPTALQSNSAATPIAIATKVHNQYLTSARGRLSANTLTSVRAAPPRISTEPSIGSRVPTKIAMLPIMNKPAVHLPAFIGASASLLTPRR